MKTFMVVILLLLTTRERAAQMFRAPSSTTPKKIDRKFQPIDHTIKETSGSSRTEKRKSF